MKFVCPKCGKQITVTNSELVALKGTIVCPQCLTATTVPYKKPAATRSSRSAVCPSCGAAISTTDTFCQSCGKPLTPRSFMTATPPPRRAAAKPYSSPPPRRSTQSKPVINFSDSGYNSGRSSRPAARKSAKKSKQSRMSSLFAVSSLGCFCRSVAFTAMLFVIYVLFGKLIEM